MKTCVVTGAAGLIGSKAVRTFASLGFRVVGVGLRRHFFGEEGSTRWNLAKLSREVPAFKNRAIDIRDFAAVDALLAEHGSDVELVIHAAAQPSHDWGFGGRDLGSHMNALLFNQSQLSVINMLLTTSYRPTD